MRSFPDTDIDPEPLQGLKPSLHDQKVQHSYHKASGLPMIHMTHCC